MSDTEKAAPRKGKGKGKKLIVAGGAVLLLGGGGAGAAAYAGIGPFGHHGPSGPDHPHLVARSGTSEADIARYETPTGDGRVDPAKFQASYYPLHDNFTSNLAGSGQFVQLGLGVSTYYDSRVLDAVKLHEMAVRSAVLLTLTNQNPAILSTPQGKEQLKDQLRKAINDVLERKEGFGGIDDVYFTSLVIQ
jgi:flagellar FliL protein